MCSGFIDCVSKFTRRIEDGAVAIARRGRVFLSRRVSPLDDSSHNLAVPVVSVASAARSVFRSLELHTVRLNIPLDMLSAAVSASSDPSHSRFLGIIGRMRRDNRELYQNQVVNGEEEAGNGIRIISYWEFLLTQNYLQDLWYDDGYEADDESDVEHSLYGVGGLEAYRGGCCDLTIQGG